MKSKNEMNSFLEAKLALLKSYDLLTEKMQESFSKGDLDGVMTPLSLREEIIRKIERVDSSMQKLMFSGKDKIPETAVNLRGMLDGFCRNTKKVLEQIALKEKDLIPGISRETEKMKKDLLRMRETRSAAANYSKPGASSPRFLDARK
jgi:hypothetical protein